MKFAATILAAAAFAFSAVQASFDWTADSTLSCAQQNWATIKASADPMLGSASSMLTPELLGHLKELLGDDGKLIANPTIDQLRVAANIFPTSLFEMFAGDLIKSCLATYSSSVVESTTSVESITEATTTEATTTEATTTEATTTEATTEATTAETATEGTTQVTTSSATQETAKTATEVVPTSSMRKCVVRN